MPWPAYQAFPAERAAQCTRNEDRIAETGNFNVIFCDEADEETRPQAHEIRTLQPLGACAEC